jgi:hypothetical protein
MEFAECSQSPEHDPDRTVVVGRSFIVEDNSTEGRHNTSYLTFYISKHAKI